MTKIKMLITKNINTLFLAKYKKLKEEFQNETIFRNR